MGKKKKVISGYMYFLDVQFTLGHEIDELVAITAADRVIWEGSVTQSQTLSVYQDQIFGGFDREGGMAGQIDVMFGGVNQSVNPFLKTSMEMAGIGGPVPAYRGSCNLFFRGTLNNHPDVPEWTTVAEERPVEDYLPFAIGDVAQRTLAFSQSEGFYWTANSPYFKPPSFKVRRSKSTWYPEKATIVNNGGASKNLNPAHIIYETITNGNWGMGYPLGAVDDAKMRIAADKLYQEGFGMGLRWNNQMSIEDFLKYVLQHIAGVMNTDRSTGKYYVKLIRDDQNINTLPLLNPDNCILDDYNTVVPGETVNQITIKFVNHLTGKPNAVTIDDLKGVFDQGQVIAQQLDMMGVNDPDLAARIAQREMNVRSRPLSKIALTCTREAYSLYEGDAFAFSWPELGIQMVQYRVLEIDLGTLEDNKIVIQAVEDVFGMPQSSYARPQAPGWVDNNQQPLAVVKQAVREISYYELFTQTTESDRQGLDLNFSFNRIFAEKPQGDTIRYKALYSPSGVVETFTEIAAGDWTPTAVLSAPVGELTETLQIGAGRGLSVVADGSLAYIGDEIVLVESFGTGTINVKRGCVDTQPKDHPAGETIWFHDTKFFAEDDEERLPGEQTVYKLLTVTSNGTLPQSLATPITKIVQGRMIKPYPPANVKISGNYFPDRAIGGLNLEWSSRNRVLQTVPGDPVHWKMGDVTPEPGTNYRVKLFAGNTPVLETFTAEKNFNLTNLTTEIPNPVTIEIASVNGTNVCAQPFRHTVTRVGYGLRYGESWGGLNTPGVVLPPQEATIDVAVSIAKQSMSQFLPIGITNVVNSSEKRILFKYLGFDRGNQQYRPGVAWMLPDDDTIRYNMLSSIPYGENITLSDNFLVAQGGTHFSRTAAVTAHLATSANYQTMERQGWPNANIGNTGTLTNLVTDGQRVVTGTTHTNSPHPTNLARVIAYSDNGLEFQDAGNFTGLGTGFKNCKFINGRFWFGCELVNGRVQFASTPQNNQGQLSVYSPIILPVSTLTTYWGFVRPRDFFTNRVIFEVNSSSASGAFVDGAGSRLDFAAYDGTNFSLYQIVGSGSTDVWTGFTTFQNKLYAFSKGKIAYTTDLNSWTIVNLSNPGWLYQNAMVVGSICIVQRFDSSLPFAAGNDAAFKLFKTSDFVTFTELDIQPWVP